MVQESANSFSDIFLRPPNNRRRKLTKVNNVFAKYLVIQILVFKQTNDDDYF